MITVNQTNYKPKEGIKYPKRTKTQLTDYQPLEKMLANLTIAGLNASAKQSLEYYDTIVGEKVDIPLLPRHIAPDINEVHMVSRQLQVQKQLIEDRVREAREQEVQKAIAAAAEQKRPVVGAPPLAGVSGQSPPA